MNKEQILKEANALQEEMRAHRRWLHAHAETGFDLTQTKPYVAAALEKMGWRVHVIWECQLKKDCVEATFAQLLPLLKEELGCVTALAEPR